ncbi:hypothetical protein BJ166DRAFT_591636 [Pestalotiopsis sp. NC0098]|nr:hypothetical protein BJ166DRAFT_591636 [Pestalotiopsis sp. NC0098]
MASPRSTRAECHAMLQVENVASPRSTREECYAMLEVEDGAPIEVVKKAFRTLALVYHPDKAGAAGVEKFQKLLEAYMTLVAPPEPASPEPPAGTDLGTAARHPLLTLFQAAGDTLLSVLPQAASDTLLSVLPQAASNALLSVLPQAVSSTLPLVLPQAASDTLPPALPQAASNSLPPALPQAARDTLPPALPQAASDTPPRQDIDTPLPTEIPDVLKHAFITLSRAHFALSTRRTSAWGALDVLCKKDSRIGPYPAYVGVCEDRAIYDPAFDRIGSMINDSSAKLSGPQTDTPRYGVDGLKLALWSARLELLEGAMLRINQELEELRELIAERRSHGKSSWYSGSKDAREKLKSITRSISFMVDDRLAPALAHDGLN